MNISKRRFALALPSLAVATLLPRGARAQAPAWKPTKAVEFIVPAGPGGALDAVARMMKQGFDTTGILGQPFIVIDKPGGNGKIAFNTLQQREGDGHTLSINTHGYLSNYIGGNLDILPHRDLTPLCVLLDETITTVVRPDSPYKNVQELVAQFRKKPESLSIAVAASVGNHIHVAIAKALKAGGVDISKLTVVAFRSSGESLSAMIGGNVDVVAASTPNVVNLFQAGRIKLLAVSSGERLGGALANVPTWREQGIDSVFQSALGVVGPKGMTAAQIAFWDRAYRQVVETEEWKRQLEFNQSKAHFLGHAEAVKFYEEEYVQMHTLLQEMGLAKR
jgi:putative tricarboxylic transport membrane protein